MNDYEKGLGVMAALFGRDYQFALATTRDDVPSLRFVDTYCDGGSFYVVTHRKSRKAMEIALNPSVALCSRRMYAFSGKAYDIGHPLKPENQAIRIKLIEAFKPWYFRHNDEADEGMHYLRIDPETGFFHLNGTGYQMDFRNQTARTFPFAFDTVLTEE